MSKCILIEHFEHPKIEYQSHRFFDFGVNLKIVWKTVKENIPVLKKNILYILEKEEVKV